MKTDRIVMRPRSTAEAIDLGFALVRANYRSLLGLSLVWLLALLPLVIAASLWLPLAGLLVLWWLKPLLDRSLLHALALDLLDQPSGTLTTLRGRWLGNGTLAGLTFWRFHPARSFLLPVWQLEGQQSRARRRRQRSLSHGNGGSGMGLTLAFIGLEVCILAGWLALGASLLPLDFGWLQWGAALDWSSSQGRWIIAWLLASYALTILLTEPFYLGAGLGLYLNQRCRLECWDLEPGLRAIGQRHGRALISGRLP